MPRRLGSCLALLAVALVSCAPAGAAGPELWAGRVITLEDEGYRLSDEQRADRAWQNEVAVMNGWLAAGATILGQEVAACPAAALAGQPARGARERDGVRARVQADAARTGVAHAAMRGKLLLVAQQQALADWFLRRAAATGDVRHCQAARAAGQLADLPRGDGMPVLDDVAPPIPGAPRVALRRYSIEAMPLVLARRVGAASLTLVDVGSGNPAASVGSDADAAVASSVDLVALGRDDFVDAYNLYDRAPVAIAALLADPDRALASVVVADAEPPGTLAATLAPLARPVAASDSLQLLGWYATGAVDGVLAQAPLPQYLAAQYGGSIVWDAADDGPSAPLAAASLVVTTSADAALRQRLIAVARAGTQLLRSSAPEDLVDAVASDFPQWEPDAVLAAVRVAARCANLSGQLGQAPTG